MICPCCQSDNISVVRLFYRGDKSDVRKVQCGECKTLYYTETTITHIIDNEQDVEIAKAGKILEKRWDAFKNRKFKQVSLF